MVFSVMLVAPSWGGMLNGLLTLRGAWDKVRQDPMLKFMVVAVTAYGMATLEGPDARDQERQFALALHGLDHRSRPHRRARLERIPDLQRALLAVPAALQHEALVHEAGQLPFLDRAARHDVLRRADVLERHHPGSDVEAVHHGRLHAISELPGNRPANRPDVSPARHWRLALHLRRVAHGVQPLEDRQSRRVRSRDRKRRRRRSAHSERSRGARHPWGHRWLEAKPLTFTALAIVAVLIGGLVEIVPMYLIKENVPTIASVKPYTPLEVMGRDIYIREGCVGCHSQMIRPFRSETERYGEYSKAGEFVYDHPFLWGSKRTGPDLHRDRRQISGCLALQPHGRSALDFARLDHAALSVAADAKSWKRPRCRRASRALRKVGVPYPEGY